MRQQRQPKNFQKHTGHWHWVIGVDEFGTWKMRIDLCAQTKNKCYACSFSVC